jgi:hypothetical protein
MLKPLDVLCAIASLLSEGHREGNAVVVNPCLTAELPRLWRAPWWIEEPLPVVMRPIQFLVSSSNPERRDHPLSLAHNERWILRLRLVIRSSFDDNDAALRLCACWPSLSGLWCGAPGSNSVEWSRLISSRYVAGGTSRFAARNPTGNRCGRL